MKIKADIERMQLIGNNIIDKSADFANKTRQLENEIDDILSAWDGEEAAKYIKLLKENYVINLSHLAQAIENYGIYIKDISSIYSSLEKGTIDRYNGGHY